MEPGAEQQSEGAASSGVGKVQEDTKDEEWLPQAEQAGDEGSSSEQQAPSGIDQAEADDAQQPEASSPAAAQPDAQESAEFVGKIEAFFQRRSAPYPALCFNRAPLDVFKLWRLVSQHGGYDEVCKGKLWARIGREFDPPASMTNLSFYIKQLYSRSLLAYEREQQGVYIDIPTSPRRPRKPKAAAPTDAAAAAAAALGGAAAAAMGQGQGAAAGEAVPRPKPANQRRRASQKQKGAEAAEVEAAGAAPEQQAAAGQKRKAAEAAALEQEGGTEASPPEEEDSQRPLRRRGLLRPRAASSQQAQQQEQQQTPLPPLPPPPQHQEQQQEQQEQQEQPPPPPPPQQQQQVAPAAAEPQGLAASEQLPAQRAAHADEEMAEGEEGGQEAAAVATAPAWVAEARSRSPMRSPAAAPDMAAPAAEAQRALSRIDAAGGDSEISPSSGGSGGPAEQPVLALEVGHPPPAAAAAAAMGRAATPQQVRRSALPPRPGKRQAAQGDERPRPRSQRLRDREVARSAADGVDEMLAAEQLAALASAALDLPAAANHSGGSATAGAPAGQQPKVEGPGGQPDLALDGLQAAPAAPAAGEQGGAGGAGFQAAAAHAAGDPSWAAAVAAAGAPLGLSQIDLPTSIVLMQQAAGVIRGLHEELQRTKTQVAHLTAELAAARSAAEAAQLESRQVRAAGQQAHAALQLLFPGTPVQAQQPQMTMLSPPLQLLAQARPALAPGLPQAQVQQQQQQQQQQQPPSPRAEQPSPQQPSSPRMPAHGFAPAPLFPRPAVLPQQLAPRPPPPQAPQGKQRPSQALPPGAGAAANMAASSPPLSPRFVPAAGSPAAALPRGPPVLPASAPATSGAGGPVPVLLPHPIRPVAAPASQQSPLPRLLQQLQWSQAAVHQPAATMLPRPVMAVLLPASTGAPSAAAAAPSRLRQPQQPGS